MSAIGPGNSTGGKGPSDIRIGFDTLQRQFLEHVSPAKPPLIGELSPGRSPGRYHLQEKLASKRRTRRPVVWLMRLDEPSHCQSARKKLHAESQSPSTAGLNGLRDLAAG
jgi:hypothetical protein